MLDQPVPNPVAKNPSINTHKVFAAIGLILIGAIVILAGIWWYVDNQSGSKLPETDDTNTKVSTSSAKKSTESAEKDETANWKTYTDSTNGFSIKYPNTWLTNTCDDNFFTSPTKETLGICASEFGGMVGFSYIDTDYDDYLSQEGFNDLSYLDGGVRTETTVADKIAVKISGTYKDVQEGPVKNGAKRIFYIINDSGKVISLNYYSESGWGDYSQYFEQMVSTLKFI